VTAPVHHPIIYPVRSACGSIQLGEKVAQAECESREHVAPGESVGLAEEPNLGGGRMDPNDAPVGVHQPDQTDAGREVLAELPLDFGHRVTFAQHFDREVRGEG